MDSVKRYGVTHVGSGSIVWTNSSTGERTAWIGYHANLGEEHGRVRLTYTSTHPWTGEKRDRTRRVGQSLDLIIPNGSAPVTGTGIAR